MIDIRRTSGVVLWRVARSPPKCEVSSVIWCTGYRNDFDWIDLPAFDGDGEPVHRRGVVESVAGRVS